MAWILSKTTCLTNACLMSRNCWGLTVIGFMRKPALPWVYR
jgi:hypothetical protein